MYNLISLIIASLLSGALGNVLPPYAAQYLCHTSSPDFQTCLVNNTNAGLRRLKGGVPEANISSLDPMFIDSFAVKGSYRLFRISMVMDNITLYGQGNTEVNNFTIDTEKQTASISFFIPYLNMTTTYYARGHLIVIPITSSANFSGNFTNINITLNFCYERVLRKDGNQYYYVTSLDYSGYIGGAHIKLTAIDSTSQSSVDVLQDYFNDHDQLVLQIVYPLCKIASGVYYQNLINDILGKVPADEILPN